MKNTEVIRRLAHFGTTQDGTYEWTTRMNTDDLKAIDYAIRSVEGLVAVRTALETRLERASTKASEGLKQALYLVNEQIQELETPQETPRWKDLYQKPIHKYKIRRNYDYRFNSRPKLSC